MNRPEVARNILGQICNIRKHFGRQELFQSMQQAHVGKALYHWEAFMVIDKRSFGI